MKKKYDHVTMKYTKRNFLFMALLRLWYIETGSNTLGQHTLWCMIQVQTAAANSKKNIKTYSVNNRRQKNSQQLNNVQQQKVEH